MKITDVLSTVMGIEGAVNARANKSNFIVVPCEDGKAAERANRPVKVKGPNPEAQARRDELDAKISALPSFTDYTATDIMNALAGQLADNVTVMAVGSGAKRLVEKGVLTVEVKEKKSYYTKA